MRRPAGPTVEREAGTRGRIPPDRGPFSPMHEVLYATTRRDFFLRAGLGFGSLALAAMMGETHARADVPEIDPARPLAPRSPHFDARADSVIFLFMEGGPSHIDL